MTSMAEPAVNQLVSMGFNESQAKEALQNCGGNLEQAVNFLLGVAPPTVSSTSLPSTSCAIMISGDISQYSVENGRSACTCIALSAATSFLEQIEAGQRKTADAIITPQFLNEMVTKGVETYQRISREGSVEHLSAEEVLQQKIPEFGSLKTVGCVRQGVLAADRQNPMGLYLLLQGLMQEVSDSNKWLAVLITKAPETVIICLPPSGVSNFILLDSHPRSQFGGDSSYGKIHESLSDLVTSLEIIFPQTDLGPDVPEMMSMMYNSFDLYPLVTNGGK